MKRLLLLLLVSWPVAASEIEAEITTVQARLAAIEVLTGKFEQQKILPELPFPLKSQGDFLYVRTLGLQWQTQAPIQSELLLTDLGLSIDGSLTAQSQLAAEIFFALFTLDQQKLAGLFQQEFKMLSKENWQLQLWPHLGPLAEIMARITVSGAQSIDALEIHAPRGDITRLQLTEQRQLQQLTPAQQAIFQP